RNQHKIAGNLINNMDLALGRLKTTQQKRDEVSAQLSAVDARLQQKQQDLAALPPTLEQGEAAAANSVLATQIKGDILRQDQEITLLRQRYNEDNPILKQKLRARSATEQMLQDTLASEAKTPIANPSVTITQQELDQLRQQVKGYQAQLAKLND